MITLTTNERAVLLEVLNQHLDGMADAKEAMIEDTYTLSSLDVFSETLQTHELDTLTIEAIKEKVLNDDESST